MNWIALLCLADGIIAGFLVGLWYADRPRNDGPGDRGRSTPPPSASPGPVVGTRSGPRPIRRITGATRCAEAPAPRRPRGCTPGPASSAELLLARLDRMDGEGWRRMLEAEKLISDPSDRRNDA